MSVNTSLTDNWSNNWSIGQQCFNDIGFRFIKQFLSLFYIMSPIETTYDDPYQVPNYEVMLLPVIGLLFFMEQITRIIQRKEVTRLQDVVINSGSALIFTLTRVFLLSVVIFIFAWIHNNYSIIDLPLHSVWTWILSLILVEFVYYWTHRALHEFNILWAAHQFHHMAEDVNITTTVRDSVVDLIIYDIFPLPLAVIIPPPILVVHIQFSLIYQVWLHNEVVGNLGFIEYIINTPRQHRVHHGKNPYCIDKNFGALIMIWDRIFGTYQTEREKIIYGVVADTPKTYDSMVLQFGYYRDVWQKFKRVNGFGNKMAAIFKGPGWAPGKPRLGLISDVPEPDPKLFKYSYDPYIPIWKKVYVLMHGIIILIGFFILADHPFIRYSPLKGLIGMLYIIFTLTSFGAIFDDKKHGPYLEIVRCVVYFPFDYYLIASIDWRIGSNENLLLMFTLWFVRILHMLSILVWISHILYTFITNEDNGSDYENNFKWNGRDTSMKKRTQYHLMVLGILLIGASLSIAWILQIESCALLFNQLNYY